MEKLNARMADDPAHTRQGFVARNRPNLPAPNLLAAAARFHNPKLVDTAVFCGIKALHQSIRQKRPRLTGERQRFLCDLLNR